MEQLGFAGSGNLRAQGADKDVQAVVADVCLAAPALVNQHRVGNDSAAAARDIEALGDLKPDAVIAVSASGSTPTGWRCR